MFRNFVTRNFPFLEDDFDALTDYQLFCKFMAYVKKLNIQTQEIKKEIEELEKNIHEEVSDKIDEMWENGDFNDIISYFTGTTLTNVVNEIPDDKVDNTIYEEINYEEEINDFDLSKSIHYLDKINASDSIENISNNIIKVASFNIENENIFFTDGLKATDKYNLLSYVLNKMGCNLIGLNEVTTDSIIPATDSLKNNFNKYITFGSSESTKRAVGGDYGNAIASNLLHTSTTSKIYVAGNTTTNGYIKNVYTIGNKTLSFYCTHLNWLSTSVIQDQLDELYIDLGNDTSDYKIIVGDFNFYLEEYATYLSDFISLGYKLVNTGQLATFDDKAIDEIMVSSNIDIISSGVHDYDYIYNLSDHKPIYATLELK